MWLLSCLQSPAYVKIISAKQRGWFHQSDGRFSDTSDIRRSNWAGHEFFDDARNDTVWNKVTATIKNAATTASFEVLVEMLKAGVLAAIQK